MNIAASVLAIAFFLILAGGVIALQVFLSKRESRWPGLILPLIFVLISLLAVMNITVFQTMETEIIVENGMVIERAEPVTPAQNRQWGELVMTMAYVFLLCNIPTAVLLAIYAAYREKGKRRRALDKMSVQDLE